MKKEKILAGKAGELASKVKVWLKRNMTAARRARRVRRKAADYYWGMVHHCARLSAHDHGYAYLVHRVGPFAGPEVEQIRRPDTVSLAETSNYVVVKDGYVYGLDKSIG